MSTSGNVFEPYIPVAEAAKLLHQRATTLYPLLQNGRLDGICQFGGWYVDRRSVERELRRRHTEQTRDACATASSSRSA